jgi:major membrane immunogen (membrane-anchored lipoprotein)
VAELELVQGPNEREYRMVSNGTHRICSIAAFIAACSLSHASSKEDHIIDEISVYRTPGKPHALDKNGQPGEQITAKREGERCLLIVTNNLGTFHEKKTSLDPKEWKELVTVVMRNGLLDFRPEMNDGVVYDFGDWGFRIKAEQLVVHDWTKPIKNGRRPTVLFQHMAKLARKKVAQFPLHYLTPDL